MPTTDFLMRIRKQAEDKGCKSSKVFTFQNWLYENSKTNAAIDEATTPSPSPTEGRREADKDPIHRIKEAMRREKASWKPLADAWRKVLAKKALEETPV
jgi:rubrerythrin